MNPALIAHTIGGDTRETFAWLDDDDEIIIPDDAAFDVDDAAGAPVVMDESTIDDDGTIRVYIAADHDIDPGVYLYTLRALSTDWSYVSAGILRVRNG